MSSPPPKSLPLFLQAFDPELPDTSGGRSSVTDILAPRPSRPNPAELNDRWRSLLDFHIGLPLAQTRDVLSTRKRPHADPSDQFFDESDGSYPQFSPKRVDALEAPDSSRSFPRCPPSILHLHPSHIEARAVPAASVATPRSPSPEPSPSKRPRITISDISHPRNTDVVTSTTGYAASISPDLASHSISKGRTIQGAALQRRETEGMFPSRRSPARGVTGASLSAAVRIVKSPTHVASQREEKPTPEPPKQPPPTARNGSYPSAEPGEVVSGPRPTIVGGLLKSPPLRSIHVPLEPAVKPRSPVEQQQQYGSLPPQLHTSHQASLSEWTTTSMERNRKQTTAGPGANAGGFQPSITIPKPRGLPLSRNILSLSSRDDVHPNVLVQELEHDPHLTGADGVLPTLTTPALARHSEPKHIDIQSTSTLGGSSSVAYAPIVTPVAPTVSTVPSFSVAATPVAPTLSTVPSFSVAATPVAPTLSTVPSFSVAATQVAPTLSTLLSLPLPTSVVPTPSTPPIFPMAATPVVPDQSIAENPTYASEKSAFLAPFEVFFDALKHSEIIEGQLRNIVQTSNGLHQQQEHLIQLTSFIIQHELPPINARMETLGLRIEELKRVLRLQSRAGEDRTASPPSPSSSAADLIRAEVNLTGDNEPVPASIVTAAQFPVGSFTTPQAVEQAQGVTCSLTRDHTVSPTHSEREKLFLRSINPHAVVEDLPASASRPLSQALEGPIITHRRSRRQRKKAPVGGSAAT